MTNDNLDSTPPATEQAPQKTEEEVADRLYDPALTYGRGLRSEIPTLRDVVGMNEQEAEEHIAASSQFFSDARIPVPEARTLHGLFVHHLDKPADDATVQAWTIESRKQLRETYGGDADAKLAAVNEFLGRYPGLNKHLKESGLGSHPRVVMSLAGQARNFRAKGK